MIANAKLPFPIPSRLREAVQSLFQSSQQGIWDVSVTMLAQAFGVVIGFATSVLLARGLGPSGLGQYALVMSLAGIAASLSDLGIGQTAIRFASRAAAQMDGKGQLAVLRWAFQLRVSLVLVSTGVFFGIAPLLAARFWHDPGLTPLLRLGLLGGIFAALAAVPMIYFQSLKRFGMNSAISVAQRLVALVGILLLAWLGKWSVFLVLIVTLATAALGAGIFLVVVPKAALWPFSKMRELRQFRVPPPAETPVGQELGPSLEQDQPQDFAFFMLLSSVIVMMTLQADVWLIGYFLDKSQLGIYSAATRFTLPLTIVLGALTTALWPRASALGNRNQALILIKRTFRISLAVAVAGAIYAFTAPLLTPWLFGENYAKGSSIGQILCLGYCVAILGCPVSLIGYSFGLVRWYWLINLLQFAVVLVLLFLFLPRFGVIAAAWTFVANAIVGIGITLIVLRKRLARIYPPNQERISHD